MKHPLGPVCHEVPHARLAAGIAHRRRHAARLVQCQHDGFAAGWYAHPIDVDDGGVGIDLGTRNGDLAVNCDPALTDELIAHPPAADPGRGEDLLQSHLEIAGQFG